MENASAASSFASACSTFEGTIALATDIPDRVSLNGLQQLQGDLRIRGASQLTDISSDSLRTISGTLTLDTVQLLTTFDFPKLRSVDTIDISGLPNAPAISFLQTLETLAILSIQNTPFEELEGFNLQTIDTVTIANNFYLNRINLQPFNVTGKLLIQSNGVELDVSLPNIESAQSVGISNCSGISMPSLTYADSLTLTSNYITAFNGAPLLRTVNSALDISGNGDLRRIALPELQTVGSKFTIANNTQLATLDTLYSLREVRGDVAFNGSFTE